MAASLSCSVLPPPRSRQGAPASRRQSAQAWRVCVIWSARRTNGWSLETQPRIFHATGREAAAGGRTLRGRGKVAAIDIVLDEAPGVLFRVRGPWSEAAEQCGDGCGGSDEEQSDAGSLNPEHVRSLLSAARNQIAALKKETVRATFLFSPSFTSLDT